ncbi:MAG: hypothetical protein P0119_08210 [Nitrospira sp.]|nr:hypothetical protein [Nitrospira sp.]
MIMIKTALVAAVAASMVSAFFVAVPPPAAVAEERDAGSDIELLRADLRTKKMQLIADRMQFTRDEADIFWPLYRKYEVESAAINDKKIAVMEDYRKSYESLSDAGAKDLARRVFEVDQMTLDLRKKAFEEIAKALSPKTAARFLQLERRLQQLVDVQLASAVQPIKK